MSRQEHQGSSFRTVLLVILAIAAWHSNPDDQHFERWVQRRLASPARKVEDEGLHVTSKVDRERMSYGLFSVVTVYNSQPQTYLGAFGRWWVVPDVPK